MLEIWLAEKSQRKYALRGGSRSVYLQYISTGDPLHSRALAHSRAPLLTQPYPHCSQSRAPGNGCVYLRCRAVCKLPGCVEGHPWFPRHTPGQSNNEQPVVWLQRTILQSINYSIMTNHNSFLIGHISLLKLLDSYKSQNWPLQQSFKLITKSTLCQLHWLSQKSLDTTVTWHKQNMTNDTVHNHALFPWCQLDISRKLLS